MPVFPPLRSFSIPSYIPHVPPPLGGFPPTPSVSTNDILRHVTDEYLSIWGNSEVGPRVIGLLSYDRPEADASKAMEVASYLRSIFDCPHLVVGAAEYKRYAPSETRLVFPLLISGLSAEQAKDLVEYGCFAAPSFTLFCSPWEPFVTDYAFTLQGYSLSADEDGAFVVSTVVQKTLQENLSIGRFVQAHHDNLPDLPPPSYLSLVVDNIYAEPITLAASGGGVDRILFNVYIISPTKIPADHDAWLNLIRGLRYRHMTGCGTVASPFSCAVCFARDHPTGLCRYTDIAGWHLKPPTRPASNTTRGHGRGGFRGRRN